MIVFLLKLLLDLISVCVIVMLLLSWKMWFLWDCFPFSFVLRGTLFFFISSWMVRLWSFKTATSHFHLLITGNFSNWSWNASCADIFLLSEDRKCTRFKFWIFCGIRMSFSGWKKTRNMSKDCGKLRRKHSYCKSSTVLASQFTTLF